MMRTLLMLLLLLGSVSPARADVPTLKIGYLPITDHLTLGVAQANESAGYRDVRVEPIRFADWASLADAVRSGSLDGAFLLAPLAFRMKLAGTAVKILLLGHRDGSAIIVPAK